MLTKKEIKVLELRNGGLTQAKISKKLKISQPAVSLFESNIRKKVEESMQILKLLKDMNIKYNKREEVLEFKK